MRDRASGPMISVVVPCHNGEDYIRPCLDSIFGQDRPPEEVVLVDDGSTDGMVDLARRYGPRVRIHSQRRQGAGAARNTGVRLAAGNYIGFLDVDDLWPADSLSQRLAALEARPDAACATGLIEHFRNADEAPRASARALPPIQPTRLICAMLVRRAVFDRIGLFDPSGRLGDQFDWIGRLADSGLPVIALDKIVLLRRVHDKNMGTTERERRGDYLHVLKSMLDRRRAAAQEN